MNYHTRGQATNHGKLYRMQSSIKSHPRWSVGRSCSSNTFIMDLWPQSATYNKMCRPSIGHRQWYHIIFHVHRGAIAYTHPIPGATTGHSADVYWVNANDAECEWTDFGRLRHSRSKRKVQIAVSCDGMRTGWLTEPWRFIQNRNIQRDAVAAYTISFSMRRHPSLHRIHFCWRRFRSHSKCLKLHASLVCVFCCNGFTINYLLLICSKCNSKTSPSTNHDLCINISSFASFRSFASGSVKRVLMISSEFRGLRTPQRAKGRVRVVRTCWYTQQDSEWSSNVRKESQILFDRAQALAVPPFIHIFIL